MFGRLICFLEGIERVHLEKNTGKMNVTDAPQKPVNFSPKLYFCKTLQ